MACRMLLFVFAMILFSTHEARTFDVFSSNHKDPNFIKVTVKKVGTSERVTFASCTVGIINDCVPVGNEQGYSMEQLRSERLNENLKAAGLTAVDLGIIVGAAWGVSAIGAGAASLYGVEAETAAFGSLGAKKAAAILGAGLGVKILAGARALNPLKQYQKGQVLKEDVITGKDIHEDITMTEFRNRLSKALSDIGDGTIHKETSGAATENSSNMRSKK